MTRNAIIITLLVVVLLRCFYAPKDGSTILKPKNTYNLKEQILIALISNLLTYILIELSARVF